MGDAASNGRGREDVALGVTADVLREVRKAKSQAGRPMRAPVRRVLVRDTAERLAALELGAGDLVAAGAIESLEKVEDAEFAVEVELAAESAAALAGRSGRCPAGAADWRHRRAPASASTRASRERGSRMIEQRCASLVTSLTSCADGGRVASGGLPLDHRGKDAGSAHGRVRRSRA